MYLGLGEGVNLTRVLLLMGLMCGRKIHYVKHKKTERMKQIAMALMQHRYICESCTLSVKPTLIITVTTFITSPHQECALKFMRKEASVYGNGHGAAHHPTRAFHMLRGEALAWLYAMALLDSVYMLQEDLKTKSKSVLSEEYSKQLTLLQPDIPLQPKKCDKLHCKSQMTCYTDFEPHYSRDMLISDLIVNKSNWKQVGRAFGPRKDG